jgi:hypothetical protein
MVIVLLLLSASVPQHNDLRKHPKLAYWFLELNRTDSERQGSEFEPSAMPQDFTALNLCRSGRKPGETTVVIDFDPQASAAS